ncbi:hypothetical protein [Streptomyces sp. NPDC058867]|uniref:hypothetical protein n=1 Tax=unclassified Streptomyces TaxID=2593676 RepID=UPI0036B4ED81
MADADPRRDRVAELIVSHSGGARRGSGYRVAPGVVLTAAHVLEDAVDVLVSFEASLPTEHAVAAIGWRGVGTTDIALIVIPPVADDGELPRFGRVGASAEHLNVQMIGFPLWKLRTDADGSRYRDSHQAFGTLAPLSNARERTLEITVGPPPDDPSPDVSPWEAMSGAAVWAQGRIVGVVKAHHPGDGLSRLAATPLDVALTSLQPALLASLRALLPTLPAPADLPDVLARPDTGAGDVPAGRGTREVLRAYLETLVESFHWLQLQGIEDDGSLRIELEKIYVALEMAPETDYDLGHIADLHSTEVREAAGGTAVDALAPELLTKLDAEIVRRGFRPSGEGAGPEHTAQVATIADAFRAHRRMVILGKPGSGKSTLGRWLALQLARGMLDRMAQEVPPVSGPALPPDAVRVHVAAATRFLFSRRHFLRPGHGDPTGTVVIDTLPERGTLTLAGTPAAAGQAVPLDQIERLAYTPAGDECGTRYAEVRFSTGGDTEAWERGVVVIDVGHPVRVPVAWVDPGTTGPDATGRLIDLGPARVPVFLRLAHFAHELARRERAHEPPLSLAEYLGRDPDLRGADADGRNAVLRTFLDEGRAVIVLDGLDELPEGNRRTVSLAVQKFIEEAAAANAAEESDWPWRTGGNQVIVTSRYVGYRSMSIRSGCVHFGIRPMERPAVEHFVRMWTAVAGKRSKPGAPQRPVAEDLVREIYDDARPGIRTLATNPLHVTILATVYWADGRLPEQLAGVYDRVVERLLRIWLSRPECQAHTLTRDELLAALEPLAAEMQDSAVGNGLVGLDRIGELIATPLARMRHTSPSDRAFQGVLRDLLTVIKKHVGLLAEESDDNYAFSHRTLQEFLAARHILAAGAAAAETIIERLDDPHWREPLKMALGLVTVSAEWGGPQARTQLLRDVLAGDDRDPMIARAAMLMVDAFPGLGDAPEDTVARIVGQLLKSYAFGQDQAQAEGLREEICAIFARLRRGPRAEQVVEALADAIRGSAGGPDLAGAAAQVLQRTAWFTTVTADALLEQVHRAPDHRDAARQPVRWALVSALGRSAEEARGAEPADLDMPRLLARHLPMRRLLESKPELTAFVRGDTDWLWLMVALYGGIGQADQGRARRARQTERLRAFRHTAVPAGLPVLPSEEAPPLGFAPGDIVYDLTDAGLSRTVRRHLIARLPAQQLAGPFRELWEGAGDPAGGADAVVGLAALGEDVVPLIRDALADPARRPTALGALSRFRWLQDLLREPLVGSAAVAARTIPGHAPEDHQVDLLRIAIDGRIAGGGEPLPVSDRIAAYRYVDATTERVRDAVEAEYWSHTFSGLAPETLTGTGTGTGSRTVLGVSFPGPGGLPRGWSGLPVPRNESVRHRLTWPRAVLTQPAETPVQRYLAALDRLLTAPDELGQLAGHVLGRYTRLLDDHRELLWETLAVCCLRDRTFRSGFLSGFVQARTAHQSSGVTAADAMLKWGEGWAAAEGADAGEIREILAGVLYPRDPDSGEPARFDVRPEAAVTGAMVHTARIHDPYLRFRALWRLAGALADLDGTVADLAVAHSFARIADPRDLARAVEAIALTEPNLRPGDLPLYEYHRLRHELGEVVQPADRARAMARLALLAPDHSDELLAACTASLRQIDDDRQLVQAIREVRAVFGGFYGPAETGDTLVEAVPDAWLRDLATERASRLVARYRAHYGQGALAWRLPPGTTALGAREHRLSQPTGHLPWGLLYLNATAAEAITMEAVPTDGDANWDLLRERDPQAAVAGLLEAGIEEGLRITPREALLLTRLVESDRGDVLGPLWAHLRCPDRAARAIVSRWTDSDPAAARWAALVQAEAGHLTPGNVSKVIELIGASTDRLRLRAALALHGTTPHGKNRDRRWSVRRVGAASLDTLAGHLRRTDLPPVVLSSLEWVRCDIHHDDGTAIDTWLEQLASGSGGSAEWIVESIESIDAGLLPRLLAALPRMPAAGQRALLTALCKLAHNQPEVMNPLTDSVHAAVTSVPETVRGALRVVHEGPAAYLKAARKAVTDHRADERLQAAERLVVEAGVWLGGDALDSAGSCMERLKVIGEGQYITIGLSKNSGYWAEADTAAAPLRGDDDVLRLLLAWVESVNPADDTDDELGHLLTALNALAQAAPHAFTALADPDVWEVILTECSETAPHWNKRLAAVRLLGLLRRVSGRISAALCTAMGDVSFVQKAAYTSVARFRQVTGDIIPELIGRLNGPDAAVAASTARLLVALAQAEGATADRRRILLGLRQAAAGPAGLRGVYLMLDYDEAPEMSVEFVDSLGRLLYRAILEIRSL